MNPWLILGAVLAIGAAAGASFFAGEESGRAEVQQKWDNQMRQLAEERAKEIELAREKEQNMQESAETIRKEKEREIRDISARNSALVNSLRDRPERSSNKGAVPSTTPTCSGASGAELARRDGEFLAGYSADAAKLAKALELCTAQYETVRAELLKK
jgi:hypothetical protein